MQSKGWKAPADAIKAYRELETVLGSKRFEMPSPNWDEKKWGEFWTAAGRPESPEKYPNSEVKLPETVSIDESTLKTAKESLHKLGLSTSQAKGVLDFYYGYVSKSATEAATHRQKAMDEATNKLKSEWADDYDKNIGFVKKAYAKFATPDFEQKLIDSGIGNDPDLIRFFSKVGVAMSEDSASGKGGNQFNAQDAESAQTEIARLKLDSKFQDIFFNPAHAEHKTVVAQWEALHKRAFGSQKAA